MNVNQGELAWIHCLGHVVHGTFVEVCEFMPQGSQVVVFGRALCASSGPAWWVESKTGALLLGRVMYRFPVYDSHLRPIRGGLSDEVTSNGKENAL